MRRRTALRCSLLAACCLLMSGCRQDMQDQPRYEYYEPSRFFADGQASRPLVEGTVPRGEQFRNSDAYQYTGVMGSQRANGSQQGASVDSGAATGAQAGGVGAASANLSSRSGGAQSTGDVNVRGNTAGGIPPTAAGGGSGVSGSGGAAAPQQQAGPDVFPFPITEATLREGEVRFNAYCSMCHGMTGEGDGMIVRRGFRRPPSFHQDDLQPGSKSAAHIFDVITNGWGAMPSYSYMIPAEQRWQIIAYIRTLQLSRRAGSGGAGGASVPPVGGAASQPTGERLGGPQN